MDRREFVKRLGVGALAGAAGLVTGESSGAPAANRSATGGRKVKVTFQQTDELFANPGMGWQTFHRFADEDRTLEGLPSGSAYFRFYWSEVEPREGEPNFARFDELLARARRAGQKLAFRIMCVGTNRDYLHVPAWLKESGCPGFEFSYGEFKHWAPDMDDPRFLKPHLRFIEMLGKRYDGHPDLDLLDIGSVGLWGEWHMSGTGVRMPTLQTRLTLIDAWRNAFPKTPKVMLIGDEEGLRHAVRHGCGWRADCLGDMGGFSRTWNHMQHLYRQQIEKTQAGEAWKNAPVAWESCWDMRKWKNEGWDIRYIFDYALDLHGSYLNNKSAPIPEGTRPEIERFLRKLGYRLVLREAEFPATVSAGRPLVLTLTGQNVGVAPPYRDLRLTFRLSGGGKETLLGGETSLRGWLPGQKVMEERLALPRDLPPGRWRLAMAVTDPGTSHPAVRLANSGRGPDGWYPLGEVTVQKA
ncbi:MAG: DUF4832 domain-containing protein [Armatimonadota bacterium]|nr:DUF4832 domain-containing protein [Armatimonadota bacterium]